MICLKIVNLKNCLLMIIEEWLLISKHQVSKLELTLLEMTLKAEAMALKLVFIFLPVC